MSGKSLLTRPKKAPVKTSATKIYTEISSKRVENNVISLISKTYFGNHNGRYIKIDEGKNYREIDLKYCVTKYQSKQIAEEIVERCPLQEWKFIEFVPLFGTLSLALLDLEESTKGYLIESMHMGILETNIIEYGYEDKTTLFEKVDVIPKRVNGGVAIVHLDPKEYKPKSNYTVMGKPLEELMERLYNVMTLIVLILPQDSKYSFKSMKFITLEDTQGKFSSIKVGFLLSDSGAEVAKNLGLKFKLSEKQAKTEWYDGLKKYLLKLFTKTLKVEDPKKYVTSEMMEIWVKIFTHESKDISPDKTENYQEYETIGDFILKGLFVKYIWEQTRGKSLLRKDQLTMLQQNYMSKHYQPKLSNDLGLHKYLRINKLDQAGKEDIFEAFVAGYFEVSDKIGGPGAGYINVMKLLKYLFEDIHHINFATVQDSELTLNSMQVKLLLEKLHFRHWEKVTTGNSGKIDVIVGIPNIAVEYLRRRGIVLNNIIGKGSANGDNKTEAKRLAYDDALNNLNRAGFTKEFALKEKARLDTLDPEVALYEDQIIKNKKLHELLSIYFVEDPAACVTYLYGVNERFEHNIIAEVSGCDFKNAKETLIRGWISK